MRVITGYLKGRKLKFPKGIRPTQDKIRKAILDILGEVVRGSQFLELFAGSGAVGIEVLSNLANEVVFVENNRICAKILKDNTQALGLKNYQIIINDVFRTIEYLNRQGKKFDVVFLDPPYYGELAQKTLQKISLCDILKHSGIVIVEHHRKDILDKEFSGLSLFKQKKYGDKGLSFYEKR